MKIGEVEYNGLKFKYRVDTTDWGIIKEACGGLNTRLFDVEPNELWLDIGAHIGAFTCYAASKHAQVMAFEPIPDNFSLLRENVLLNNFSLGTTVQLNNKAVGLSFEPTILFIDRNNFGNCSIYPRGMIEKIEAPTIPVSSLNFDWTFKKCVKIDTEGCEYDILSELDLSKVHKLVFEYHYWLVQDRAKEEKKIAELLADNFTFITEIGGYMHYAWK